MILGIGCDIVQINRLKDKQNELSQRILTDKEYEIYSNLKNDRQLEFLAGRFAAKEAIFKALNENIVLSDIEILNDSKGKPFFIKENVIIHITISHEKEYALAYAIVEER